MKKTLDFCMEGLIDLEERCMDAINEIGLSDDDKIRVTVEVVKDGPVPPPDQL